MAKLRYSEKDNVIQGKIYRGVEITFEGRDFFSRFYPGDTRTLEEQVTAHKERLYRDAAQYAEQIGKPIPDRGDG